ncbi:hypothetical protein EVAR_95022_1 [Eumeta japonica]|uniref:Uncharacterized protein n=1 Tax=Eumeta variegata TaxID=151549 RepID=A0A4C1VTJ1_EUMVA|nr:hypothetical protein EVAR_95022_1 [Eumeta japonica]
MIKELATESEKVDYNSEGTYVKRDTEKNYKWLEEILELERDVTIKVKRLKWRWDGHVIRGHDKWSKRVTRWYPREGKRKRDRPQKRWDDDIRQVAGVIWNRVAQDRNEWKRLEEAFADWQTDLGKIAKEQILDEIKV